MGTLPKHGSVSVVAAAPPEAVWDVLSDVTRTGEWSHEAVGSEWIGGATGPVAGARFRGRNHQGMKRWSRRCEVLEAAAPRRFSFRTVPSGVYRDSTVWTFELEPAPEGGTRITQRFQVVQLHPLLERLFYACLPAHRDRSGALREDLERLAALAESEGEAPLAG